MIPAWSTNPEESGLTEGLVCRVCGAELSAQKGDDVCCLSCGHKVWFDWDRFDQKLKVELGGLGIVTEQNMMRVLKRIETEITEADCSEILLDFGPMTHLTSTALGHLVVLKRKLDRIDGLIRLKTTHPELQDIFRITRLDSVFTFEPGESPAGRR